MKIGFCYDIKEDYGYESDNLDYTDFVSLHTVSEIKNALENNGHDVIYIGNLDKLVQFIAKGEEQVDLIFNIAEGINSRNREALIPAYLEAHKIMHTGSDAFAMALTLNKYFTNVLVQKLGILVPKGFIYKEINSNVLSQVQTIGFPVVIKPNSEGGSMGLRFITDLDMFISESEILIKEFRYELLCEEYIEGKELTVPIMGNGITSKALGVVSITYEDGTDLKLYDAALKCDDSVINSLDIGCSEEVLKQIMECSVTIHNYFQLNDYSRMDFRLNSKGEFYFLETNLLPSLARGGSFELCGKKSGKTYDDIIGWIVSNSLERYGKS
jgi:D-alanine-D-alanine ligase